MPQGLERHRRLLPVHDKTFSLFPRSDTPSTVGVPQWVVRKTLEEYQDRASQIFLSLAVQLIFEVVVDFFMVRIAYRGWDGLILFWELCKRVL